MSLSSPGGWRLSLQHPYCIVLSAVLLLRTDLQVERLSGLLQKAQKLLEPPPATQARKHPTQQQQQQQEMDPDTLRQTTINSSVNIRQRIVKLFELCENDLYGKLQGSNAQIAVPYRA